MSRRKLLVGLAGIVLAAGGGAALVNTLAVRTTSQRVEGIQARDHAVTVHLKPDTPGRPSLGAVTISGNRCLSGYGSHQVGRDGSGRPVLALDFDLRANPRDPAELARLLQSADCRGVIPGVVSHLRAALLPSDAIIRVSYHTARGARIILP